jgi:signal transduction histidine kinase
VITNLLQNAYEALADGGTIRVGVRAGDTDADEEARVEISIEDDGPGMDTPTRERAFVPFFTTKETGVGFGLALCERLVRAQGGTIDLRSIPDRGTRVTIGLPVRGSESPEQP